MMLSVFLQLALTADASDGNKYDGAGGLLLLFLLLGLGVAFVYGYDNYQKKKKDAQQLRREEQFHEERAIIRKAARLYSKSGLVQALCKRIRKFPESPEIKRIEIGTDCMTVTLDGLLKTEPKKTVPYADFTYKDLNEENCPFIACALAAALGVPFHVEFQDGYPTAALIVVREKLLDPNIEPE